MTSSLIPEFNKKFKPTKKQLLILSNLRNCEKVINYIDFRLSKATTKRAFATFIILFI